MACPPTPKTAPTPKIALTPRPLPLVRASSGVLSLTPGFSPVHATSGDASRFNGFPFIKELRDKPLKRLFANARRFTGLKPGVNEITTPFLSGHFDSTDPVHQTLLSSCRRPIKRYRTVGRPACKTMQPVSPALPVFGLTNPSPRTAFAIPPRKSLWFPADISRPGIAAKPSSRRKTRRCRQPRF